MNRRHVLMDALKVAGKSFTDITQIYYGRDHQCRYGCGGKYIEANDPVFIGLLSKIDRCKVLEKGEPIRFTRNSMHYGSNRVSDGIEYADDMSWINIPLAGTVDRCYCIYFN